MQERREEDRPDVGAVTGVEGDVGAVEDESRTLESTTKREADKPADDGSDRPEGGQLDPIPDA